MQRNSQPPSPTLQPTDTHSASTQNAEEVNTSSTLGHCRRHNMLCLHISRAIILSGGPLLTFLVLRQTAGNLSWICISISVFISLVAFICTLRLPRKHCLRNRPSFLFLLLSASILQICTLAFCGFSPANLNTLFSLQQNRSLSAVHNAAVAKNSTLGNSVKFIRQYLRTGNAARDDKRLYPLPYAGVLDFLLIAHGIENGKRPQLHFDDWPKNSLGEYVVEKHVLPNNLWSSHSEAEFGKRLDTGFDKRYQCVSIIMAAHNEQIYLKRTIESIFNATNIKVLKEIIIVDDNSTPPMQSAYNESIISDYPKHVAVRFIRNSSRLGLVKSKILGGNSAEGEIIVFLDAHVKPEPKWINPILQHINSNYKRVVVPMIPILDPDTWEVNRAAVGVKMMFDWALSFNWLYGYDSDWVPCMSGGLLAMSKKWWTESGTLDEGMMLWGGENIEQSIRVWLCGGEIVVARNSFVGHVFRDQFPYSLDSQMVETNRIRAVDVWFDEYKEKFYNSTSRHSYVKNRLASKDLDVSARLELRRRLKCKPFKWYVDRFSDIFFDRNMIPRETFLIRNPDIDYCLSPTSAMMNFDKKVGKSHFVFLPCDPFDKNQRWAWRKGEKHLETFGYKNKCLDAANPTEQNVKEEHHQIVAYACNPPNSNHFFELGRDRVLHLAYCLAVPNEAFLNAKSKLQGKTETETQNSAKAQEENNGEPIRNKDGSLAFALLVFCNGNSEKGAAQKFIRSDFKLLEK